MPDSRGPVDSTRQKIAFQSIQRAVDNIVIVM
jgi:hypothetical protein